MTTNRKIEIDWFHNYETRCIFGWNCVFRPSFTSCFLFYFFVTIIYVASIFRLILVFLSSFFFFFFPAKRSEFSAVRKRSLEKFRFYFTKIPSASKQTFLKTTWSWDKIEKVRGKVIVTQRQWTREVCERKSHP